MEGSAGGAAREHASEPGVELLGGYRNLWCRALAALAYPAEVGRAGAAGLAGPLG